MNFTGETLLLPDGSKANHFTHNKNGLKVLIVEKHDAPICGYMRVVNAGSAMENGLVGKGIAHFIEHMSFRIDGGKYWQFEREGHEDNAMTTEDSTSFYDFGDSNHIHDLIKVDGHRFLTADVPANGIPIEMMAVLNEKKRGEQAMGTLFRTAQATSHLYSNYHCPTIGLEKDIKSVTAEDMKMFRETYYKLTNSTFVVVGHVNTEEVLKSFEDQYGHMPYDECKAKPHPEEPLQMGKREVNLDIPAPCAMMCMAWHSPPANSKDSIIMQVLSKIISDGNGGRKMKVLESGILHNLGVYAPRNVDKYIWCIHGAFDNPSKLNKGQGAVMNMLGHIQREVTKEEVKNAVNSLREEWGVEPFKNIHSTTMALGQACALNNWKDVSETIETLKDVEVQDIKKIIGQYLTETKLTIVKVNPTKNILENPLIPLSNVETAAYKKSEPQECTWFASSTTKKKNNMEIQHLETSGDKLLISISIPFKHDNRWEAAAFEQLFGTGCNYNGNELNADQIQNLCTALGVEFGCNKTEHQLNFSFEFNKHDHLDVATDFVVEGLLKNTVVGKKMFSVIKRGIVAEINSMEKQDKYQVKANLINKLFTNTPYAESISLKSRSMNKVSSSSVGKFYDNSIKNCSKWYCTITTPKNMNAKDFSGILSMVKKTGLTAAKGEKQIPELKKWLTKDKIDSSFEQKIMPGFGSTTVMMGQVTNIENYSKKAIALSIAVQALGGGMTSRLMWTLRGKDGRKNGTYGVYAQSEEAQKCPVFVVINATFTPSLANHGITELKSMISDWSTNGITKEELDIAKKQLIGNRTLLLDDFSGVSSVFHRHLFSNKNGQEEWNRYVDTLKDITSEDVEDAMKEIHPHKWATMCTTPVELHNNFDESDKE